jgi:ADP-ribosylglycohydrolase
MTPEEMKDRFRGCLVGQALGDACGFPLEGMPPARCREQAKKAVGGKLERSEAGFAFGQYTDDTQMAVAIAKSLAEKQTADPEDVARRFAELWTGGRIVGQGLACRQAVMAVIDGVPWDQAGAPEGRAGNGTAMRTAPVGLFFCKDPQALFTAADQIARITHRDQRSRAGAAAISSAVAHLVQGGEPSPKAVLEPAAAMASRLHKDFAEWILQLAGHLDDPEEEAVKWFTTVGFTDGGTDGWEGITPYVVPTVLGSFYSFLKHPKEYVSAIQFVIACGGDVDTTAAITGALSGSHLGLKALPDLAKKVTDRGRNNYKDLVALADQLFDLSVGQPNG